MDNPILVYDESTAPRGGNNINDITKILLDRSLTTMEIHPVPLATDTDWDLKALAVREQPDLIIIHASCFYEVTSIDDPKGTFRDFLEHVGRHLPNTKLLIYSRAFQKITREDIARYERASNLVGRVKIFPVTDGENPSFRKRETRNRLIREVEAMLGS